MKYTIETLIEENPEYHTKFGILQKDVEKVNYFVQMIEKSRNENKPLNGDIVRHTSQAGNYRSETRLCSQNETHYLVNTGSFFPHVCQDTRNNRNSPLKTDYIEDKYNKILVTHTSGSFETFIIGQEVYEGKTEAIFKTDGTYDQHNTIWFKATVNVWEAKADKPFYGDFTTKDWACYIIHTCYREEFESTGCVYTISIPYFGSLYFKDTSDLAEYIKLLKGTEFISGYYKGHILWCYSDKLEQVNKGQWDKLDLPIVSRKLKGENHQVKIRYDDDKHRLTSYFIDNENTETSGDFS